LLREAGRHNDAYIVLDSALSTQPDSTELLYETALTAERIGKPELLESHLKHLLALKPDHAHALNALGYSLAERNVRLDEAHDLIAKALSLAPEDPFIMDSMGWVLYRQGKLPESLQAPWRPPTRSRPIRKSPPTSARCLWAMGARMTPAAS
jgi:Flp pilus assembly protein TadD